MFNHAPPPFSLPHNWLFRPAWDDVLDTSWMLNGHKPSVCSMRDMSNQRSVRPLVWGGHHVDFEV